MKWRLIPDFHMIIAVNSLRKWKYAQKLLTNYYRVRHSFIPRRVKCVVGRNVPPEWKTWNSFCDYFPRVLRVEINAVPAIARNVLWSKNYSVNCLNWRNLFIWKTGWCIQLLKCTKIPIYSHKIHAFSVGKTYKLIW